MAGLWLCDLVLTCLLQIPVPPRPRFSEDDYVEDSFTLEPLSPDLTFGRFRRNVSSDLEDLAIAPAEVVVEAPALPPADFEDKVIAGVATALVMLYLAYFWYNLFG